MFTVFLRGRGGKGVATSLGVALALSPIAALVGFVAYAVVFAATRLSSLGSLLGVWTFALLFALREQPPRPLIALAIGGGGAGHAAPPREHRAPPSRRRKTDLVERAGQRVRPSGTITGSASGGSAKLCVAMRAPVRATASSAVG